MNIGFLGNQPQLGYSQSRSQRVVNFGQQAFSNDTETKLAKLSASVVEGLETRVERSFEVVDNIYEHRDSSGNWSNTQTESFKSATSLIDSAARITSAYLGSQVRV